MIAVDLQVVNRAEKSLDELIGGLNRVKSVQRNGILDAGIMRVEGDNVVDAHADQLLQCNCAVERFPCGPLGLKTLIQVGHNDRDPAGFPADRGDHTLEVGKVIVGRHVVVETEHAVGLIVIDHIYQNIEIHTANRLLDNTLALSGPEAGNPGINDVRGLLIGGESGAVSMFMLAFCAPVLQVVVDFLSHLLASGDSDQTQLAERCIVEITFLMSFDGFHQLCCPFFGGG